MELRLGRHTFGPDATLMMAIVNRTRDSFYDGERPTTTGRRRSASTRSSRRAPRSSTSAASRAGYGDVVDAAEEIRRVVPFVAWVREHHPGVVISVDTWRSEVAREVCAAGADLLNDAWGGHDPRLVEVAAEFGAAVVCTHTGGLAPRTDPYRIEYDDVVAAAIAETTALAERALAAGVARESIVIDPAHDFGKNTFHSLEVTRRLGEMVDTGWPVLVSLSNKDFVGETLDVPHPAAAHRHAGRDVGLRARRCPHLPRPPGARDPADRRHGVVDRGAASAAAGDPGPDPMRVALVPGVLAFLPEYAGLEDPVAEVRAASVAAAAWVAEAVRSPSSPTSRAARVARHSPAPGPTEGDGPAYLVVANGSARRD